MVVVVVLVVVLLCECFVNPLCDTCNTGSVVEVFKLLLRLCCFVAIVSSSTATVVLNTVLEYHSVVLMVISRTATGDWF